MKRFLPIVFTIFLALNNLSLFGENPNNWTTYFENNEVKIEYLYQNCDYTEQFDSEYVIIKATNLTDKSITIEWKEELWYDEKCINCNQDSPEYITTLTLPANSTLQGECNKWSKLKLFSKFTEKLENMPGIDKISALTKFELKNIKTK